MSSSHRRSIDSLDAYPFPRHDSSTRSNGSTSTRVPRSDSSASISSFGSTRTNSIGVTLDIRPLRTESAIRETGQNAISTLLQPPIVRTGLLPHSAGVTPGYRAPTSRDIPPVTLTNIPHVEPAAFKEYLATIGPLFDSIARRKEEAEEKPRDGTGTAPASPVVERSGRSGPPRQDLGSLSPVNERAHLGRRASGGGRRKPNEPFALSTVPTVYFDEDFHLENPRTFDVVSERAELVRSTSIGREKAANGSAPAPRKALATNAILQEKLSWYMDTVEVHLINSISEASGSFFEALGSLRNLQKEAEECATKIQSLRAELALLDRGLVKGGLELSQMRMRRRNVNKLCTATAQVQRVIDHVVKCEEQVDEGDFETAANGLEAADRLVCGQPDVDTNPLKIESSGLEHECYDLRELRILQTLTPVVHNLHGRIGRGFEVTFLESLLNDLRGHVDRVPTDDTLKRWANASQRYKAEQRPAKVPTLYIETGQGLRNALSSSLKGLYRAGYTGEAANAFRAAVMKEMKTLTRRHLPSSSDEDAESVTSVATRTGLSRNATQQEKSAALARNLRALDEQDAETMLFGVVTNVSEALRRLGVQVKVLLDVTSNSDRGSRTSSPVENGSARSAVGSLSIDAQLRTPAVLFSPLASPRLPPDVAYSLDMSAVLGQAVDVAQIQLVRVLKVRTEQTSKMPLERFVRYYTVARFFANECEAISGSPGQALLNATNAQLAAFVTYLAESESQRMASQLESEQWEAQDFTDKDQVVLQRILDGMTSDPSHWTKGTLVWQKASSDVDGALTTNGDSTETAAGESKKTAKAAYIDETRFILVKSATVLLACLDNFCALVASVPNIVPTVVPGIMDVLRTFNSRSSQLILGAGATRVAGLKNITTKHLALSSQALSFVIALVPYIREAIKRHAKGRNEILMEFDKIRRLFQDHQMGIHDKLVEIMTARARSHSSSLKKIDFDAETTEGPSAYMETLTKESGTLYRVLNRHLSEGDVGSIMSQIAKNYREVWMSSFGEADAATEKGKSRLRKDAELFDSRLSKISGFGEIAKSLLEGIDARKVQPEPSTEIREYVQVSETAEQQETENAQQVSEKSEANSEGNPQGKSEEKTTTTITEEDTPVGPKA